MPDKSIMLLSIVIGERIKRASAKIGEFFFQKSLMKNQFFRPIQKPKAFFAFWEWTILAILLK
jgi:hypothetical protein